MVLKFHMQQDEAARIQNDKIHASRESKMAGAGLKLAAVSNIAEAL